MARIRTVKPEFVMSQSMANVPREARLTFILLWTICDDQGRYRADERIIKGQLFPLDDDVSAEMVAIWLKALEREGAVCRYEVGGTEFLHVVEWHHQKINKPSPSRLPPCPLHEGSMTPPELPGVSRGISVPDLGSRTLDLGPRTVDLGPTHTLTDRGDAQLTLVPTPAGAGVVVNRPSFDDFWAVYPRKVGKEKARKAWGTAIKKFPPAVIVDGARRYRDDPNLPPTQYQPYPERWLNGGRWDDEPCVPRQDPDRPSRDDEIRAALARADAMAAQEARALS